MATDGVSTASNGASDLGEAGAEHRPRALGVE